jgi:hypothetical protein
MIHPLGMIFMKDEVLNSLRFAIVDLVFPPAQQQELVSQLRAPGEYSYSKFR